MSILNHLLTTDIQFFLVSRTNNRYKANYNSYLVGLTKKQEPLTYHCMGHPMSVMSLLK